MCKYHHFNFDIRKDSLYCDKKSSIKRQACINLLGLILDILLKWFAPILSFTTEEIFQIINKGKNSSIHLEAFPKIPNEWKNKISVEENLLPVTHFKYIESYANSVNFPWQYCNTISLKNDLSLYGMIPCDLP